MVGGIFTGLFSAWILSIFNFDGITINALNEIFGITISTNTYYFIFAVTFGIGGWISDISENFKYAKKQEQNNYSCKANDSSENNIDSNEPIDVDFIDVEK